jgi:predicted TIM-barrel fold metal-dependent hydrolase
MQDEKTNATQLELSRRRFLAGTAATAVATTVTGMAAAGTHAADTNRSSPVIRDLDDVWVMDSTVHAYSLKPENSTAGEVSQRLADALYHGLHRGFSPRGQDEYLLDEGRFMSGPHPHLLAHALFAESQVDVCIYHGVPNWGLFRDGGSPLWVGKQMRERWPGRVALYGPVSPWQKNPLEEVDRLVEEDGVIGIKLYPLDLVDGEIKSYRLDDPKVSYPIIERAQARGIKSIAIHKAIPFGRVPMEPFRVTDIDETAIAFPDMTFEIVHGGFAFLEETAAQLHRFSNVVINLEGGSGYLCNMPRKFAELLGTFLLYGGDDRIVWSVGTVALHPRPFLEAFWKLEMPEDLMQGYGFPALTPETKAKILGINHARILGLDIAAMQRQAAGDEWSALKAQGLAPPWSGKV